ncbi:nucleoside hydrolase [Fictibacillus phosphorivorans]|uniref:nucleoside hydrolase n=1 Tax=Fictibacillus phosphorivorans TaxID=1221500 RepID=UPI002041B738|nr:nucleoside hydrolase [Fictibacillus phosphorivorans]MCM3717611.1 nucleoside hydrolase [Fictibacillus phosphorivorans]MCM3775511.1 nucleoside hydrolase [Fictibacillus phosphorivorans]
MGQKVLFFGDVGIDDTIALTYAYLNDEIDIVGVVSDYGNVSREQTIANVHYIAKLFHFPQDVKTIGGAEVPMTGEQPKFYPEVHGEYGLGPIVPGLYEGVIENFFEIVNLINQYENELIIVNVGRLTSLATMFILFQSLMKKVKAYYIMGGAFWVPGNVTAVSEANFHGDPIAVKIVLTYANNLTIIPLNVTDRALVTPEMVDYIDYKGKAPLVKPLLDFYYKFYKKTNPSIQGSPVHDAITLMAVIREDMFTYRTLPVHIGLRDDAIARGQSIADIRPYINFGEEDKKHRIAFDFNYTYFFNDFMTIMTGEKFG